jgi:hypothetical protein
MSLSLNQGEWIPSLQFSGGDGIGLNEAAHSFPRTASAYEDLLKNEQQSPMIVRSLSMIYDWAVARALTSSPMEFEVKYRRRGVPIALHPQPLKVPPSNFCTGLYGTTAVISKPWVYKLAAPFTLKAGQSILLTAAVRSSESYFTPVIATGGEVIGDQTPVVFTGRGKKSGEQRRLATPKLVLTAVVSGAVIQNTYDEDIAITHMTWVGTTAAAYRHCFRVEVGNAAWSKGVRPMWMFAEPFLHSRLDFSRLPEGGLVLYPNDGFEVTLRNTQYNTQYYGISMDAYQQVA